MVKARPGRAVDHPLRYGPHEPMDFLLELVFQVVFEIVGELLMEIGFKASARVLRSKLGRGAVSLVVGFVFGVWWGAHLADQGSAHHPRLLWVSIAMAVAAGVGSLWQLRRAKEEDQAGERQDQRVMQRVIVLLVPWRWPAYRLLGFALLNTAIAAGILTGWRPPTLG